MSLIETKDFNPDIVKPFMTMPYFSINKVAFESKPKGNLYGPHDYYMGLTLNKVREYTDPSAAIRDPETVNGVGFLLGQYHNTTLDLIVPQEPSHDLMSDLMSGIYKYLCTEEPQLAYIGMQAFYLMTRVASDTELYIGGTPKEYKVKTYAF